MDHRGGDVKNQKTSKPKQRQHREKHNKYRRTSHSISSLLLYAALAEIAAALHGFTTRILLLNRARAHMRNP